MQERGLSIVIPTLNEGDRIGRLLEFLFSQNKGGDLEVIVVDALHSTDTIKECVEFHEALYVKSRFNSRAAQMHEGAKRASHPFIAFLHADVVPPVEYLDSIEEAMSSGQDFGYFSYRFDKKSLLLRLNGWFTQFKGIFTGGGDQMLFMRRTTYLESGGFDPNWEFMEDFEYHRRLTKKGLTYKVVNKPATVSARKYEKNSYFKVNLVNLCTLLAFKWGVHPDRLKSSYIRILKIKV